MCTGIATELNGINLGDQRLNRRAVKVLESLAANPEASVNGACGGWSETLAAYRFFDNPSVTPAAILRPHREATAGRMREQSVVLIAQDTTELDYTSHPPRDAQCLDKSYRLGLYDHTQLALTPEGLCLGVVGCEQFDRTRASLGHADERATLPIEEKESFRWLSAYRQANQLAIECPATQIISVGDSEADLYDIFIEADLPAERRADFLVRARVERCLTKPDPTAGAAAYCKARAEVERAPLLGIRTLDLSTTPKRAARTATLEIRAITVTLKPPHARSYLPSTTLQVVLAEEINGPGDGTDVSWLLFTSLPAATLTDTLCVLDFYAARWTIEVFFRVLKTGCRVEEIQLETMARLQNCLAFYKIIAARVLYLTHLNRTAPELPCSAVFAPEEWKSVWRVVSKEPLPKLPPMLKQFLPLLTELGGYNNRQNEKPPGPQPLWIGIRRMLDFARAWVAFGPDKEN